MSKFNNTVNTALLITGLLGSTVVLAEQPAQAEKQVTTAASDQTPARGNPEFNIRVSTEQLVQDLHQQLGNSIQQQVSQTLKSLADSVKHALQ